MWSVTVVLTVYCSRLELGTVVPSEALVAIVGHSETPGGLRRKRLSKASVVKGSLRAPTGASVNSIVNRSWSLGWRKPHLRWADL